jgi:hypothetical protein
MKLFGYSAQYWWWKIRHPFQQLPSLMCLYCFADLNKEPDHRCGDEPDVSPDEKNLQLVIGWQGTPYYPTTYCCRFCYSWVGHQHLRDCPNLNDFIDGYEVKIE